MNGKQQGAKVLRERAAQREARANASSVSAEVQGVRIGTLVLVSETGDVRVDHPDNPSGRALPARSTVALEPGHVGREVLLAFERNDARRPVVIGLLEPRGSKRKPRSVDLEIDRERFAVDARKEIVLRCGKASITLTKAGKVLIRGAYVLTRSSGVNRIQGASVQLN